MPRLNDPCPQQHRRRRRFLPKFSGIAEIGLSSFSNTSIQQFPSLCDWFPVLAPLGLLNGSWLSATQAHKRTPRIPATIPKMATLKPKYLVHLEDLTCPRSGQFQRQNHRLLDGIDAQQTPAQEFLNQARRRFVSVLPSSHHFRNRVDTCGTLLRENMNVKDTRRRRRSLLPDPLRTLTPKEMRRYRTMYSKNMAKIDFDSARSIMERNQLISMWNQDWNSIDERRLAEKRTCRTHNDKDEIHGATSSLHEDFERCIPKMQSLKRKFGLREPPKSVEDRNEDYSGVSKRNKKEHKNEHVHSTEKTGHKAGMSGSTQNGSWTQAEEKVTPELNQVPVGVSGRRERDYTMIDEHHRHHRVHHARQQVDKDLNSEDSRIIFDSKSRCGSEKCKRFDVKRNLFSPPATMDMEVLPSSEDITEDHAMEELESEAGGERSNTCSDFHDGGNEDSIMTDAGYCEG